MLQPPTDSSYRNTHHQIVLKQLNRFYLNFLYAPWLKWLKCVMILEKNHTVTCCTWVYCLSWRNVFVLFLFPLMSLGTDAAPNNFITYKEYKLDHMVSKASAVNAIRNISEEYFRDDSYENSYCRNKNCEQFAEYCRKDFINDHCWCERGHEETLPFVPHTCYVSNDYTMKANSCFDYDDIRQCCCSPALAKWYRSLNSAGSWQQINTLLQVFALLLVAGTSRSR